MHEWFHKDPPKSLGWVACLEKTNLDRELGSYFKQNDLHLRVFGPSFCFKFLFLGLVMFSFFKSHQIKYEITNKTIKKNIKKNLIKPKPKSLINKQCNQPPLVSNIHKLKGTEAIR